MFPSFGIHLSNDSGVGSALPMLALHINIVSSLLSFEELIGGVSLVVVLSSVMIYLRHTIYNEEVENHHYNFPLPKIKK